MIYNLYAGVKSDPRTCWAHPFSRLDHDAGILCGSHAGRRIPSKPGRHVIACSKIAEQLTRGAKQDGVTVNEGVTAIFFARIDSREGCRKGACFITEACSALRWALELQQMRGHSLMRQLSLLLILFLPYASPCWAAEVIAGTIVENGSLLSRFADARSNFRGQPAIVGKLRSVDDKSTTNTSWSQRMATGVNGPIPVIVVDQFGYLPRAAKIAVIRDPQVGYDSAAHFTPGTTYAVVDQSSGKIVKQGPPTAWNGGATDDVSGDKVWWFDFSDVTIPGTYVIVDIDKGLRSVEFQIDDRVYRNVLKHAMRMYFYQRAGFKKTTETAGADWADAASHMGPGQDPQARPWQARRGFNKSEASQIKDLHGGWFDAGDYNKYTSWAARNVIALLRAYDESPRAFGDDSGIAESGNGVPDILDEVKWALDWLARMQNTDGSLLCVQALDQASPPSAATGPTYYGPATTAASVMGAAAFAYAAKIYSARSEVDLREYSNDLATRAKRAWDWATANPSVLYFNNDDTKQPGSRGLASGQQEMDDAQRLFAKFEAAIYLYELTADVSYKSFVETNYTSIIPSYGPTQWDTDRQEALLYYTRLPGIAAQVKSVILTKLVADVTGNADQLPMIANNKDPYLSPIKEYTWGSNQSKVSQARLYQLLALYGDDAATSAKADAAAMGYVHYIHGVNPLGLVYLTNMKSAGAEHSASTMFHNWFAHGTRWERVSGATPGPPPGYLVGGPNPHFSLDKCCFAVIGTAAYRCYWSAAFSLCRNSYVPPFGQPALKSYRQFNEGWPADSWEVTEPSTGYQAQYIRVLAKYVL
jgi:endoglucanase